MRIVRSVALVSLAASLAALAACSGSRGPVTTAALAPPAPAAPVKKAQPVREVAKASPNTALNGRWEPTDADGKKLYYLQLKNGGLASRSPTTNATTARGTYKVLGGDKVAIVYQSSQSSTPINLTCSLAGERRMTCSSADGSNTFSIVKA